MFSDARILIIDDTPNNLLLLSTILRSAGYKCIRTLCDSLQALDVIRDFSPDLLITDLMMPVVTGHDILRALPQFLPSNEFLPVLVLTADVAQAPREQALGLGATDFLMRPHQPFDVVLRVRNLLQARSLHLELQRRNLALEAEVAARTLHLEAIQEELKMAQLDVIERLALAGEHHDDDTGAHTRRVARSCQRIAQKLQLPDGQTELIFRAAPLHDVGKIGVSDAILLKPGKLTNDEFDTMKKHCAIGAQLLSNGQSDFLQTARSIALSHHERFDGTGYPHKLAGSDIPLEGRIVAVADVFDALTSDRPYKKAWPEDEAKAEIEKQAGRQFDPMVVEAFLSL
jgi:putative two-component system response regulator